MTAPRVFVSYSHDSQEHKRWVLELATRLRNSGVDAILDQWDIGPGGDLPHFMEQGLSGASRVLMICTERYVEKANAGAGGVGYEKMIVTADLLRQIGSNKVIPIVRQTGLASLPTFLGSKYYINLSRQEDFETGFDELLRDLLGAPLFIKPPLGNAPLLPPAESIKPSQPNPLDQFLIALRAVYESSYDNGGIPNDLVRRRMATSKLMYDHARDLAVKHKYVSTGGVMDHLWVTDAGRLAMMKLDI